MRLSSQMATSRRDVRGGRPSRTGQGRSAQHGRQGDVGLHRDQGLAELARGDLAEHLRNVHLRRAAERAGGHAIAQVIAQQQFQRRAADGMDFVRLALDLHALGHRRGAGRHHPAAGHELHQADQAEVDGSHCREKQSVGMSMPSVSAASRIVAPGGHFDFAVIDGEVGHSFHVHRFRRTHLPAGVATRAFLHVDRVPGVGRHGDGVGRALLGTERAADAGIVHAIGDQRPCTCPPGSGRPGGPRIPRGSSAAWRAPDWARCGPARRCCRPRRCGSVVRASPGRPFGPCRCKCGRGSRASAACRCGRAYTCRTIGPA